MQSYVSKRVKPGTNSDLIPTDVCQTTRKYLLYKIMYSGFQNKNDEFSFIKGTRC